MNLASQVEHAAETRWECHTGAVAMVPVNNDAWRVRFAVQWSGLTMKMEPFNSTLILGSSFKSHSGWGTYKSAHGATGAQEFTYPLRGGGGIQGELVRVSDGQWHGWFSGMHTQSPSDIHLVNFGGDYYEFNGRFVLTGSGDYGVRWTGYSGEAGQISCYSIADFWRNA